LGGRGRHFSEFEASLVYKVCVRTARATQRNPVSKKKKKKKKKKEKKTHSKYHKNLFLGHQDRLASKYTCCQIF
jgi:hypothetical protein